MDYVIVGMIFGFLLLIFATLWNMYFAPKKKKDPSKLYQHFVESYGFTANEDAQLFTGMFRNRNVQLTASPPSAFMQLSNPRGIHILFEKGIDAGVTDIIETPVEGLQGITVKSNYPMFASEMMDDNLANALNDLGVFSFYIEQGITIRFATKDAKEVEKLLEVAALLAQGLETLNYAYG